MVNAPSVSSLKNRLDKVWQTQDYKAGIDAGSRNWDTACVNRAVFSQMQTSKAHVMACIHTTFKADTVVVVVV
jgi:hypothetical protein